MERCEWVRLGSSKELHRECVSQRTVTPEDPRSPRIQADFALAAASSLVKFAFVFAVLLACCTFQTAGSHNPFIYFRF